MPRRVKVPRRRWFGVPSVRVAMRSAEAATNSAVGWCATRTSRTVDGGKVKSVSMQSADSGSAGRERKAPSAWGGLSGRHSAAVRGEQSEAVGAGERTRPACWSRRPAATNFLRRVE